MTRINTNVSSLNAQKTLARSNTQLQEALTRLSTGLRINKGKDDLPVDFPWERLGDGELYRPVGCRECRNLGYSGRIGLYELLVTGEEVRHLAHDNASSWEIKKAALRDGMMTLRMDGWDKALRGVTSVEEVVRVTKMDREISLTDFGPAKV